MVDFDQLNTLIYPIVELYERYIQSVINDIARRLAGLDIAHATAAWQMQRLTESGLVYKNAIEELSKLSGKSEFELREMFRKAGVQAMKFDDEVYRLAGLRPLPLNLSPAMVQVLAAGLRKTGQVMRNLTMTTAVSAQNAFIDAADLAYMQVTSGAFDYNSAIRNAVKEVANNGLNVIHYGSGRKDQLDVAVRRTVLTGVAQTAGGLQLERAKEMGCNLMEVSAHIGARNKGEGPMNHESWQGKVYSISGGTAEYPNLAEVTGYGTIVGLYGVNCRHSAYPFFEGLSVRNYTDQQLAEMAGKKATYNGEEMSLYEASQEQRAIERKIRYWKRQKGALEAAGLDASKETLKIRQYQSELREFTKQTGLTRQYAREQIGNVANFSVQAPKIDFRSKEYQNVAELGNVSGSFPQTEPGLQYVTPRPVMYTGYTASHLSNLEHESRLEWLEENQENIIKAIKIPEYIEKKLRLRNDGYFSITQIVELINEQKIDRKFLAIAISLSKELTGKGYHQITTIHPLKYRDLFDKFGNLKEKYLFVK